MDDEWSDDIPRKTGGAVIYGICVIATFLAVFGFWGVAAPIAGAVVSSGYFVASGQNKVIQHLEGGVIKEIRVQEGDIVEEGDPLIVLDATAAASDLRRLDLRLARLAAIEARLVAEVADADAIVFPDEVLAAAREDADIAEIVQSQELTFTARKRHVASEIATLESGVDALNERIAGSQAQIAAFGRQIEVIDEELAGKEDLLTRGFIRRPEVLALRRAKFGLEGEVGRLSGEVGDARERIARIREQAIGLLNAASKAAVEQMHEVAAEIKDVRERRHSSLNLLDRIVITAPSRGIIVKLRYHTPGGVVEAGRPVLEIVPIEEDLVIQARIRPQDINSVRVGQRSSIRLTALNKRTTPMVDGIVTYVSADAIPADGGRAATDEDGFVARVTLDREAARLVDGFVATPGMPAEVYIKTAERSFVEYVMQPVRDSMARAFREN